MWFHFLAREIPGFSALTCVGNLKITYLSNVLLNFLEGGCNFDEDFCDWINDESGDDFDWLRLNEKTPSSNTGPTKDRSGLGT